VLIPEVQPGPAAAARPAKILVLAAACGSLEYHCPTEFATTVDNIVRGGFEFAGFSVVDADQLRGTNRERHEEHRDDEHSTMGHARTDYTQDLNPFDRHVTSQSGNLTRDHSDLVVLDGPGFEDLSVDERRDVLSRSGADAVAKVRIVIGGAAGVWAPNQNVEVIVTLGVNQGETMAWGSRCSASSSEFQNVTVALEHAARCAIDAGTRGR
jgi:hypothetical protein